MKPCGHPGESPPETGPYTGGCRVCWLYANRADYRELWDRIEVPRTKTVPTGGPGTELKKLIAALGIAERVGCGCNHYAAQMDVWGPDGCRDRVDEIATRLREQAAKLNWLETAKVAFNAVASSLFLDPRDVYRGLVEEACRRAEAATVTGDAA